MVGDYDTRFQTAIASDLPAVPRQPDAGTWRRRRRARRSWPGLRDASDETASAPRGRGARRGDRGRRQALPVLGAAPEFTDTQQWFNTPGDRPLTLRGLRGRVVLVDFWTYTCINCIRTLPYLKAWDERYRDKGLTIVGVHTPEFPFEREAGNVADAIDAERPRLPRRPGQRLRHLGRLRQPVLAGEVPDRRQGPGPLRPLRRGRIRQDRSGDPRAARRSRPPARRPGRSPRRDRRRPG